MSNLVYFDSVSHESLGLVFLGGQIGTPEARTMAVDIPYSDGQLDLTDYYGAVRYKNRTITLNFIINPTEDRETVIKNVLALNGQKVKLEVPNRLNEYFIARLKVSDPEITNSKRLDLTITGDSDPYCYTDVTISQTFTASGYIDCTSSQMITSPTIENTAAITAVYGSTSVTLSAGTHKVTDFKFTEGNNRVYITPSGSSATVTITYVKGRL